ncbi:MAG: hypothetical protein KJO42_06900, partial [Silicimonas sp.]|nr:hypothetical protein [Silicimonas sp.]
DATDAPVWDVTDGTATCTANCEGVDTDAANQAIADYAAEQESGAGDQAVQDLWTDAQQRIIDDSNKSTEGIEDALLDDIAHALGFTRPSEEEIDPEIDPEGVDDASLEPVDGETTETASN